MSIREFVVGPGDGQLVGSNPWFERVPKGKQCLGQSEVYFLSSGVVLVVWLFLPSLWVGVPPTRRAWVVDGGDSYSHCACAVQLSPLRDTINRYTST